MLARSKWILDIFATLFRYMTHINRAYCSLFFNQGCDLESLWFWSPCILEDLKLLFRVLKLQLKSPLANRKQQHPRGQQSFHKRLTKSVKRSWQTFRDPWPHFGEGKTAGIRDRLNLTFWVSVFFPPMSGCVERPHSEWHRQESDLEDRVYGFLNQKAIAAFLLVSSCIRVAFKRKP